MVYGGWLRVYIGRLVLLCLVRFTLWWWYFGSVVLFVRLRWFLFGLWLMWRSFGGGLLGGRRLLVDCGGVVVV